MAGSSFMNWHYVLRFTLATGLAVMFPDLKAPKVSEIRGAQILQVTQLTYNAGLVSVETFLIEKWRSMGFAMPNDGQTFTWDQYLEPITNSVPIVGDLVGFSTNDSDTIAGIITYLDAPKSALLVYVPVAPGVGQYTGVIGGKILWLIRPKAKIGTRKT
jgi:hypothetical protein